MEKKIKIGILGPSEIAGRRFAPAVLKSEHFELAGVACADSSEWSDKPLENDEVLLNELKKAHDFADKFNIDCFDGYEKLLASDADAVYIPLPPGLHYRWAKRALEAGKHVLLEKPFTTSLRESRELVALAEKNGLAVHENFAFLFHTQIGKIDELIKSGTLGELRLIRAAFGFPYRGSGDFRYDKALGGGALFDCGGYPLKLADYLLGGAARVVASKLCNAREHDVNVFGSAVLMNENGETAQIAFGMDNSYNCDLEVWGSEAYLSTGRVFSPPADYEAIVTVKRQNTEEKIVIEADDQFLGSAECFFESVTDIRARRESYKEILHQATLFDDVQRGNIV